MIVLTRKTLNNTGIVSFSGFTIPNLYTNTLASILDVMTPTTSTHEVSKVMVLDCLSSLGKSFTARKVGLTT